MLYIYIYIYNLRINFLCFNIYINIYIMPQLIPFTFVNQVSFGYLFLLIFTYFLSNYLLPYFVFIDKSRITLINPFK